MLLLVLVLVLLVLLVLLVVLAVLVALLLLVLVLVLVLADSDWGGNVKDRKSTSGGVWMLGNHCIKTWSASQGPYALSSAEAEFYAMIEAVEVVVVGVVGVVAEV